MSARGTDDLQAESLLAIWLTNADCPSDTFEAYAARMARETLAAWQRRVWGRG